MATASRRAPLGFTLVELLVVFVIIIIIAATSIPMGLNFVRNYQVEGAAQSVAAQIQKARSEAVKRNTRRGILLNFNYPATGQMQYTSLDPNPMTGDWDSPIYPKNPGVYQPGQPYGTVPDPPNNLQDPNLAAGLQSPHGQPVLLPMTMGFTDADFEALLFRADGSVVAVDLEDGPAGDAAVQALADGSGWRIQITDQDNGMFRYVYVSQNGRVTVRRNDI